MKTLVLGASGATGRNLVNQLLELGHPVKAMLRNPEKVPPGWKEEGNLTLLRASISDLDVAEMATHLSGCNAVASCLGHNLTLKGIYGKPRMLVRDAMRLVCAAIRANKPAAPVKVVLMNTTGNRNRDLHEKRSFGEKLVIGMLRLLLPPQSDNEQATEVLRNEIGTNDPAIEWVAVRPDTLINETQVTGYSVHESPLTSPVFKPGKTSRINVGNFMARLIAEDELWNKWKGQMPVLYNNTGR